MLHPVRVDEWFARERLACSQWAGGRRARGDHGWLAARATTSSSPGSVVLSPVTRPPRWLGWRTPAGSADMPLRARKSADQLGSRELVELPLRAEVDRRDIGARADRGTPILQS